VLTKRRGKPIAGAPAILTFEFACMLAGLEAEVVRKKVLESS
jgi:hypothetical protein